MLAAVEDAPRTVAGIARRLELKRQSVQRLADALVTEGLLTASDNPDDQRASLLALSAAGLKALRRIQAEQVAWANRMGADLGRERLTALAKEFEHLRNVLTHKGAMP